MKYGHYRIYERFAHERNVRKNIARLAYGSIGIDIISEAYTIFGKEVQNALSGIVLCSVERHVLKEVGQSVLVVFFLKSTYIMYDVEMCTSFWLFIMCQIIGQSVFKLSDLDFRIVLNLLLCICTQECDERTGQ